MESIQRCVFERGEVEKLLPLFNHKKYKVSEILGLSHSMCEDCCSLYTPCHVGEWIRNNPELYDYEVGYFREILDMAKDLIEIDIEPYTDEEINTYSITTSVNKKDRLRQLYTVVTKL